MQKGPERLPRAWAAMAGAGLFERRRREESSARPGADADGGRRRAFFSRMQKKGPAASYSRAGGSRTTLGDGALDFRVRNGNGYFRPSMATGPGNSGSGPGKGN